MTALDAEIAAYSEANPKSKQLHDRASAVLPGGDTRNSIFWNPFPVYMTNAEGTQLTDVDGNVRTDFVNNMTTLIMGHRHPDVVAALHEQVDHGVSYPAPAPSVVRWAEILCERVPSLDKVRFVNSGTEATLNAIRAVRAYTGKTLIAKCEGAYHGNHDAIQISVTPPVDKAGDAENPEPVVMFPGINPGAADDIVIMPYNNLEAAERIIRSRAEELAAVIVEPINGQCGMVPAKPEFLQLLRDLTLELDIPLIFDEVISFRAASGGAQEWYGITPDMTCFGKVIGGGLPVGAFGGKEEIMRLWDPNYGADFVQHAGTFNGNPMTAAAGVTTLELLTPEVYEELERRGEQLRQMIRDLIAELEVPMGVTGATSLFALQFTTETVTDYRSYATNDKEMLQTVFTGLLNEGILMSNRCAGNVSAVHTDDDLEAFVSALRKVLVRAGYA